MEKVRTDIHYLTETIGVRPPLSQEEYEAGQYVVSRLREIGLTDVQEQPFYSIRRVGERLGFITLLANFGVLIGALGSGKSRLLRLLSVTLTLLAHHNFRRALTGRAALGEWFWPQRRSQNIIARLSAQSSEPKTRVVLLAHLDTDVVRFSAQPQMRPYSPYLFSSLPVLAFAGALFTALNAPVWMRRLIGALMIGQAGLVITDEIGPNSPGANDNASGVALLLALAEALTHHPLKNTEVVLAFTGCETAGCNGAAELAAKYGKAWQSAWWLAIDSIGAGELCWVTEHGWGADFGSRYHSGSNLMCILEQVAAANPALGVMGRPLITVNAVGPLVSAGCKAAAIMGYERAGNTPVQWRQTGDTTDVLNMDTQQRAYEFIQAVLTKIDEDTSQK
ncbi:MAG: hypothetical protein DPW16_18345 [Chloroflexi bacterium]|nr:hypothetical protein [Chloroflexota bacterium]